MTDDFAIRMLKIMGDEVGRQIGPGVFFALFVEWRDGQPMAYLSNGDRDSIVASLTEWFGMASRDAPTLVPRGEATPLGKKCVVLGKELVDADIDVVLFLFTNGEPGEMTWFSSLPNFGAMIANWVRKMRGRVGAC